ncbi:MAG: tetratricopeptide repeat protein [Bacillota bacterium]
MEHNTSNSEKLTLGDKVKALRKSLKMTQTELAGNEMTKSMLSQIENNLATPSVKNLHYLASRLGKPVSYFLGEEELSPQVEKLPMEEINSQIEKFKKLYEEMHFEEAKDIIDGLLEAFSFDKASKLYADLLFKRSECLIELNQIEEGEAETVKVVHLYLKIGMNSDAAKACMNLISAPWRAFDYEECIKVLDKAQEIYKQSINKDLTFEIENLYLRAIMYSSMNNHNKAFELLKQAMSISAENELYYKADELYRIYAAISLLNMDYDTFMLYIGKALKYAEFTGSKHTLSSYYAMMAVYHNNIYEPEKALEYLEKFKPLMSIGEYWYYSECSKAYYLLKNYHKALECAQAIVYRYDINFRYDYLRLWSAKIYEGICLNKLGRSSEAVAPIMTAVEKLSVFPDSEELAFAYKSLSEIYSDSGDYENAFKALKKADEIKDQLQKK